MKRKFEAVALCLAATLFVNDAQAGFLQWSSETEKDPFTGSSKVTVDFATSIRSAVFIFCRPDELGLTIRIVPGWRHDGGNEVMLGLSVMSDFAIAVDGELVDIKAADAGFGTVGDNLAAADVTLDHSSAQKLIKLWIDARSQIAIKDGISDSPMLMTARGSTASGRVLEECVISQTRL